MTPRPERVCDLSRKEVLAPLRRWTAVRKAQVMRAVENGIVTQAEVMACHGIDAEEWAGWTRKADLLGVDGLKATNQSRTDQIDAMEERR